MRKARPGKGKKISNKSSRPGLSRYNFKAKKIIMVLTVYFLLKEKKIRYISNQASRPAEAELKEKPQAKRSQEGLLCANSDE